jgi:hypothetical protein
MAAVLILKVLEKQGMTLEPSKDHVEYGFSEHERCIVTNDGYMGSLARKVGSLVAAEPQGAQAIELAEYLSALNEARMSVICRGADPGKAQVIMVAGIMNYTRRSVIDKGLWRLLYTPKCNGGYGFWATKTWYSSVHSEPLRITTRTKIKRGGRFGPIGSAGMTDKYLSKLCAVHGFAVSEILDIRDEMVADSGLVGLGPQKFGNRRYKNVEEVVRRGKLMKLKPFYAPKLNSIATDIATHISRELITLCKDPHSLRHCNIKTPAEVLEDGLRRSGCMNLKLYMRLHRIESKVNAIKLLTNNHEHEHCNRMMHKLWAKGDQIALLFVEGKINCTFWSARCKINVEIAALVRKFVLYWMARSDARIDVKLYRQLSVRVKWDTLSVMIGMQVWDAVAPTLGRLVY